MNEFMEHVIDKFEELDWYHIGPTGKLVHGANSEEDDALYRAGDVYKLLDDLKAYSDYTKWTPCCEAKPPESGLYLATERCGAVDIHYYNANNGLWSIDWSIEAIPKISRHSEKIPVAWIELPKPWEDAQNV